MTPDPADDLVTLTSFDSPVEASLLRASLEGAGLFVTLRGETTAALNVLGGFLGNTGVIPIEVLVRREDFEAATALLDGATPVLEGPTGAAQLEGQVCPVHEQPAKATCDRCGTFLCAGCGTVGHPPLCEECVKLEVEAMPRAKWPTVVKKSFAYAYLGVFVGGIGVVAVGLLIRWLS